MLDEFIDIVMDDLPNNLPPVRSIIHHIYLIFRTILPKKVAYRLNPKENGEITNQVQDCLIKD